MTVKSEETLGNSKKYNRRRPILSVCQMAECLVWSSQSLGRGSRSRAVDLGHTLDGKGRIRYLSWGVTPPE